MLAWFELRLYPGPFPDAHSHPVAQANQGSRELSLCRMNMQMLTIAKTKITAMVRLLRAAVDAQTPMVLLQVVICHIQHTCNNYDPTAHALHIHMPCKCPKPIHTCKLGCMGAYCTWQLDIAVCTLHSMTYLPTHHKPLSTRPP